MNETEHLIHHATEAVKSLHCAVGGLSEQIKSQQEWFKSHFELATLHDLKQMEKRIMATQAEVITVLTSARDSLKQVNLDVADASVKLGELKNKITELEAAIANGVVGQELADIAAEVKTLAGAADEALPNPVVVPPTP